MQDQSCDQQIKKNEEQIVSLTSNLEVLKKELVDKTKGQVFVKEQSIETANNITLLNKTIEEQALTYLTEGTITFGEKETIYRSILDILPNEDKISIKYNTINDLILQKSHIKEHLTMFGEKRLNNAQDDMKRCVEELNHSNEKIKNIQTNIKEILDSYNDIKEIVGQYSIYSDTALKIANYLNTETFALPSGSESNGEKEKAHPISSAINGMVIILKENSGNQTEELPEINSISTLNTNFLTLENSFELDHSVHYSVFKGALEKIQTSYGTDSTQLSLYIPYLSILEKLENARCLYVENIYKNKEGANTDQPEYCTPEIVIQAGNISESGADGKSKKYLKSDIDAKIDKINDVISEAKAAPYNMNDTQLKDFIGEKNTLEGIKDANQQIIQDNLTKGGFNWREREKKLKEIIDKYSSSENGLINDIRDGATQKAIINFERKNTKNIKAQNKSKDEFIRAIQSNLSMEPDDAKQLYIDIAGDDGKVDETEYKEQLDDKLEDKISKLEENQPSDVSTLAPADAQSIMEEEKEELASSILSARTDLRNKFNKLKENNDKVDASTKTRDDAVNEAETSSRASLDKLLLVQATTLSDASKNFDTDNYTNYLELIECTTRDNINNQSDTNQQIVDNLIKFGTKTEQDSIRKAIESISEKMKTTIDTGNLATNNKPDIVAKYNSSYTDINNYISSIQQTNYDAALNPETYKCETLANEDKAAKTESRKQQGKQAVQQGQQAVQQEQVPPVVQQEQTVAPVVQQGQTVQSVPIAENEQEHKDYCKSNTEHKYTAPGGEQEIYRDWDSCGLGPKPITAGKRKTSLKRNVQKKSLRRNKQIHSKIRKTKKNKAQRKSISRRR